MNLLHSSVSALCACLMRTPRSSAHWPSICHNERGGTMPYGRSRQADFRFSSMLSQPPTANEAGGTVLSKPDTLPSLYPEDKHLILLETMSSHRIFRSATNSGSVPGNAARSFSWCRASLRIVSGVLRIKRVCSRTHRRVGRLGPGPRHDIAQHAGPGPGAGVDKIAGCL